MNALMMVRDRSQVTIKELAEALGVSAPSASVMVDRLVEMGMVTREQSRVDRREVVVQVAPEAVETIERMEKQALQSIVEIIDKIGPKYARMWCEALGRIREVLREENAARCEKKTVGGSP